MSQEKNISLLPIPKDYERGGASGIFGAFGEEFINDLAVFLKGQRVLEIFAGNGLLAAKLNNLGISIKATTILAGMDRHSDGLYYPVENLNAISAVTQFGKDYDILLMCWPTVTEDAIRAVDAWGQEKKIVFIGEVTDYSINHFGGCATDDFFKQTTPLYKFESYKGNFIEQALILKYTPKPGFVPKTDFAVFEKKNFKF